MCCERFVEGTGPFILCKVRVEWEVGQSEVKYVTAVIWDWQSRRRQTMAYYQGCLG